MNRGYPAMPETTNATGLGKLFGGIAAMFKDAPADGDVHVSGPLRGQRKKPIPVEDGEALTTTTAKKFEKSVKVLKVDTDLGLVFGWGIICKKDGEDYIDLQKDHITEDAMLNAAADFMANSRVAKEMHTGDAAGSIVFAFPMTGEIAKAYGVETRDTGLMIAMKPDADMLERFRDGTLTGFSIGGSYGESEEVP
jgi:hypothetical protein